MSTRYTVLSIPACQQSDGDRAIMALFPGVFTDGTSQCAIPTHDLASMSEETANGKNYRQELPDRANSTGRTKAQPIENKGEIGLASGLQ